MSFHRAKQSAKHENPLNRARFKIEHCPHLQMKKQGKINECLACGMKTLKLAKRRRLRIDATPGGRTVKRKPSRRTK